MNRLLKSSEVLMRKMLHPTYPSSKICFGGRYHLVVGFRCILCPNNTGGKVNKMIHLMIPNHQCTVRPHNPGASHLVTTLVSKAFLVFAQMTCSSTTAWLHHQTPSKPNPSQEGKLRTPKKKELMDETVTSFAWQVHKELCCCIVAMFIIINTYSFHLQLHHHHHHHHHHPRHHHHHHHHHRHHLVLFEFEEPINELQLQQNTNLQVHSYGSNRPRFAWCGSRWLSETRLLWTPSSCCLTP